MKKIEKNNFLFAFLGKVTFLLYKIIQHYNTRAKNRKELSTFRVKGEGSLSGKLIGAVVAQKVEKYSICFGLSF